MHVVVGVSALKCQVNERRHVLGSRYPFGEAVGSPASLCLLRDAKQSPGILQRAVQTYAWGDLSEWSWNKFVLSSVIKRSALVLCAL